MPTNLFRGDAPTQAKVYRLTPANPEPGDTFSVVINGKKVSFVATTSSVADVIAGLVAAINASTIPEFTEVLASDQIDYVSLVAQTAGQEVVLTTETEDAGGFDINITTITSGSPGQNEIQQVSIPAAASGGTFTLTFEGQTTAGIAFNASAGTVQTALEALSNIAAGDVEVTGSSPTWTVEFKQAYATTNVSLITGNGANLTGAASITHSTTTEGSDGLNEIRSYTSARVIELAGDDGLNLYTLAYPNTIGANNSTTLDLSSTASEIQTALESIPAIGSGNVYVTKSGDTVTIEFVGSLGKQGIADPVYIVGQGTGASAGSISTVQDGTSSTIDEVQTVRINGSPSGGTFTLSFQGQTTAGIAYNASAAAVKSALEALSNIDSVTVTKSGTTYTITFGGTLAGLDVAQMTSSASSLTGGYVDSLTTQSAVASGNEVQRVAFSQTPGGGTFTLTWDAGSGSETTAAIDYDATASEVQTALEGLTTPTSGDFSVSGDAGGPWLVEFTGTFAATNVNEMSGTSSLTGGGSQSMALTVTTVSLGPEHWNDPANWTLGQVPETGDDVILEQGATNLRYGLRQIQDFTADNASNTFTTSDEHHFVVDQKVRVKNSGGALPTGLSAATDYYILAPTTYTFQLSATRGGSAVAISDDGTGTHTVAVELSSLKHYSRYTGQIGLQLRNASDYYEYRPRALKIGLLSSGNKKVTLGVGEGSGSGLVRLDFDTYQIDGLIHDSGGGLETEVPAILIENTHSSSVWTLKDGEVGFAFHTGTTGEIATLYQDGGSVVLGDGMTVSTKIVRTSGELLSIGEVSINGTIEISG